MHLPDGSQQTVSGPDITRLADVRDTQYRTRAVSGGAAQDEPYVQTGLSIHHLLESLTPPFDPTSVGFTETARRDGSWSTLDRPDTATPSDFADGLLPVLRVDGPNIDYIRPLRPSGQDTNAEDQIQVGLLDLFVHTGTLLSVRSSASTAQPSPGSPVLFQASAQGAPPPIAYGWDFGDGTGATGQLTSHAFTRPGSYRVLVTAAGPNDSGGAAPALLIMVQSSTRPNATPSPAPSSTPSGGPGRPAGGPASPGAGAPSAPVGGGSGPTAPTPAAGPSPPKRRSSQPRPASAPDVADPSPPPAASPSPAAASHPAVALIQGVLLSAGAAPPQAAGSTGVKTGRLSTSGPGAPARGAGAATLVLGLFGLGAVRERRRIPGRRGAGR
ncbi:MAG: hypothetical protein NVS3B26_07280 [Mycobacteriales bacterium]